jgi:hypothetical protein
LSAVSLEGLQGTTFGNPSDFSDPDEACYRATGDRGPRAPSSWQARQALSRLNGLRGFGLRLCGRRFDPLQKPLTEESGRLKTRETIEAFGHAPHSRARCNRVSLNRPQASIDLGNAGNHVV